MFRLEWALFLWRLVTDDVRSGGRSFEHAFQWYWWNSVSSCMSNEKYSPLNLVICRSLFGLQSLYCPCLRMFYFLNRQCFIVLLRYSHSTVIKYQKILSVRSYKIRTQLEVLRGSDKLINVLENTDNFTINNNVINLSIKKETRIKIMLKLPVHFNFIRDPKFPSYRGA